MEITHLGHAAFKIKGKQVSLITDPFDPQFVGIKFPKLEADIVTVSHDHPDHNYLAVVEGNPLLINGVGEYEVKGVKIMGLSAYHDEEKGAKRGKNTVYRIEMDKISMLHCGDLGHKFSDSDLDLLDGIDILLLPVGGFYTINSKTAAEIVAQIEPKIVIPMHYNEDRLDQKSFGSLSYVEEFLKEMAKTEVKPIPKLSVSKDKLPLETTVVVLE